MEMKAACESCHADLGLEAEAFVCSFTCTYCTSCTDRMRGVCPNCSGELLPRPKRKKVSRAFSVVQGNLDHLETLATLFDGYRRFYLQRSDVDGARKFLRDRIGNQESVIFLATGASGALGFVQLYPTFSSVEMERGWILNDLFVSEKARRLGVAKALMERAHTFARSTGGAWLRLETASTNTNAQALYRQMGYEKEEGFEHYVLRV